jgi:hypothetical protein
MAKILKSTENIATKDEYEEQKTKLTELETLMSKETEGKQEAEKELVNLKKKVSVLETELFEQKEVNNIYFLCSPSVLLERERRGELLC